MRWAIFRSTRWNTGSGSTSLSGKAGLERCFFTHRSPSTARSDCGRSISAGIFAGKLPQVTQLALGLSIPALLCTHVKSASASASRYTDSSGATRKRSTLCGSHGRTWARCKPPWLSSPGSMAVSAFISGCACSGSFRKLRRSCLGSPCCCPCLCSSPFTSRPRPWSVWRLSRRGAPTSSLPRGSARPPGAPTSNGCGTISCGLMPERSSRC